MKLASFRTGLHLTLNDTHYRIEKIINLDRCYLERLSDGALEIKTKKELALYHANGDLSLHGSAPVSNENKRRNALDINGVSAEKQKEILRRFEYVKESNALLGETPTKINMDEVVRRVVIRIEDSNPPCTYTVYRWWKLWLNSGKDLMSLAKKKSGKSGSRRFKGVIETELHKVIEDMYLTKQKNSKKQVFDEFCNRINQLNKIRETPLKNFSRSTFYREIDKIDKYDVLCAREGKRIADQHFRVTGAGVRTNYILERVEVDHTPLDVIILNEHTGLADGRPTLTMLIDHYSRIPLGFEIGFEVPSELSVMRAMRGEFAEAVDLFEKAAKQDYTKAMVLLADYYEIGFNVPKNPEKANELINHALALGSLPAKNWLGKKYAEGRGVKKDPKKAFELYSETAALNDAEGQRLLAYCYRTGFGTKKNYNESVRLARLAMQQHDIEAAGELGTDYLSGNGVKKIPALGYALIKHCGKTCNAEMRIKLLIMLNEISEPEQIVGDRLSERMYREIDVLSIVDEYEKAN